jgi:hypothetical protein
MHVIEDRLVERSDQALNRVGREVDDNPGLGQKTGHNLEVESDLLIGLGTAAEIVAATRHRLINDRPVLPSHPGQSLGEIGRQIAAAQRNDAHANR